MTAEVAVMNKSAVALAADSAMSVTVGRARKTYPTNKLFALTKHHPIGIMIYNNAEFMNVPWETIVKMYRDELGLSSRATVKEYAEDFLGYVGNPAICTGEQLQGNLLRIADDHLQRIARDVRKRLSDPPSGDNHDVPAVILDVVNKRLAALLDTSDPAPSMQSVDARDLIHGLRDHVNELIDQYFADHLTPALRQSFLDVLEAAIYSSRLSGGSSGLVFAGFGEDEIFPSLVEIKTDGAIGDVVKADTDATIDLARTGTHTAIVPFGQSEMVGRFMEGIDPYLMRYMDIYFKKLLASVYREALEPASTAATHRRTIGRTSEAYRDESPPVSPRHQSLTPRRIRESCSGDSQGSAQRRTGEHGRSSGQPNVAQTTRVDGGRIGRRASRCSGCFQGRRFYMDQT